MDVHSREQRSRNMSAIRSKDTKPELVVRQTVHRLGYRFRLHRRDLPGTPDLVFPRFRKVILVHGCFWHMHTCRWGCVTPRTNADFWQKKRTGNVQRDRKVRVSLKALGWDVLTVWECDVREPVRLASKLRRFLDAYENAPARGGARR
jgi:DNA mismatch endonuclease, patch repair protein